MIEKCEDHSGCMQSLRQLEQSDRDLWEAVKKIQSRPPVWATAVISLLTFMLGCSLTYASILSNKGH